MMNIPTSRRDIKVVLVRRLVKDALDRARRFLAEFVLICGASEASRCCADFFGGISACRALTAVGGAVVRV
jgi:hypothetical protein